MKTNTTAVEKFRFRAEKQMVFGLPEHQKSRATSITAPAIDLSVPTHASPQHDGFYRYRT